MSPFPSDNGFDRGAHHASAFPSSPEPLLASAPVDVSEGADSRIPIPTAPSESPLVDETGEESLKHEYDDALDEMRREGTIPSYYGMHREGYGEEVPLGWRP